MRNITPELMFFLIVMKIFFMEISLEASPDDPSACKLNFTTYPYLPMGECLGVTEGINEWNSFPTTRCCRNALNALSEALALRATDNLTLDPYPPSLFLHEDQWKECNGSFHRQRDVSIESCGFEKLYHGSSPCSNFSLSGYKSRFQPQYEIVTQNCSLLSDYTLDFNVACKKCTDSIEAVRNNLILQFQLKGNKTSEGICGVAVVTIAATDHVRDDPQWVGDFYRCLGALDSKEQGYIKLTYSAAKALLGMSVATILMILIIVLIKFVTRKRLPKPFEGKEILEWSGLYRFSKAEIENALNFSNHKVCLGAGSAGRVYKGVLPSGQVVAIKHIYKSNMSDSFTREVEGLSRIRHPNLVCLFGCCIDNGEQYLVYEFCSNGNLAQHLLKRDTALTWDRRVKILRDCALALRFLHTHPDGCIVHRDIKLTNILLGENMEPKLSDFGLAKMLGMEESKVFTDVRGTLGYMDPEYMSNAKLTCGSDVYSFGIVILQFLSGRKVIELDIDARDQLTRKAKDVIMGKRPLTDFEDPRLKGQLNAEDFESILHIAVLCVAKSSKGRPTVDVVFAEMDKAWKNTETNMKAENEKNPSATPLSFEVIAV